jgi:hypothetical protein
VGDELSLACGDSQHYACSGYIHETRPNVDIWLRCPCTCHAAVEPSPDAA